MGKEAMDTFKPRRIKEVRQRIQTVVVYEELNEVRTDMPKGEAIEKEVVVDSFDRPLQAQYT